MTEQQFIKKNLAVIRAYLKNKFPDCVITEESITRIPYQKFIVTNGKVHKTYKLKVNWDRLSDATQKTWAELDRVDVAGCMVLAAERGEGWFYW